MRRHRDRIVRRTQNQSMEGQCKSEAHNASARARRAPSLFHSCSPALRAQDTYSAMPPDARRWCCAKDCCERLRNGTAARRACHRRRLTRADSRPGARRARTVVLPVVGEHQHEAQVARLCLRQHAIQRAEDALVAGARARLQRAGAAAVAERPRAHHVHAHRLRVVLRSGGGAQRGETSAASSLNTLICPLSACPHQQRRCRQQTRTHQQAGRQRSLVAAEGGGGHEVVSGAARSHASAPPTRAQLACRAALGNKKRVEHACARAWHARAAAHSATALQCARALLAALARAAQNRVQVQRSPPRAARAAAA